MSGAPLIQFQEVSKTYAAGTRHAFTALEGVDFTVEDKPDHGEFLCILGPSGCGKSTLLRLIAGLEPQHPPTTGEVRVQDTLVEGPGADRGMVFQDYTSFDNRRVLDNVAFGLECQGMAKEERHEIAREWIRRVGLDVDEDSRKFPHQLSGGMRQRVAIARTLALHPRIILMDEPFGALDPATRFNMQDMLVDLWRELEATVCFVTHSISEAVYLGDRIYILSSAPGSILHEMEVPPPDRPSRVMQLESSFQELSAEVRARLEAAGEGGAIPE
jgi:NitT/TauT family transport system ATP-binding protein